jgi:hypothetical protein
LSSDYERSMMGVDPARVRAIERRLADGPGSGDADR